MTPSPWTPSPTDLQLLATVIREVTRVRRLSPADAQDFAQSVQIRCIERDYDVFRRFTGRSSLRTYLRVVVTRLLLDWLNSSYGKWRPSAIAARLGEPALSLERLIERDGCTPDEAVNLLASGRPEWSVDMLQQIADALPRRVRRRLVTDEVLEWDSVVPFEDPVAAEEERHAREEIGRILRKAFKQLPTDEQRLMALRYAGNVSVRTLAERLQTEPKLLYRRFDRALRSLRRALVAAGITSADALADGSSRR
jgi:RNA polymerase sigma factor (sigma-70 family)